MTGQVRELIHFEGVDLLMRSMPLEPYLRTLGWTVPISWGLNSSCWRGYIGNWEINGGRLFLDFITDADGNRVDFEFLNIFPGVINGVFADWYSGTLIVERGALIKTPLRDDICVCERTISPEVFLLLVIKRGYLVGSVVRSIDDSTHLDYWPVFERNQ
jgi:hypothetical protein